MIISEGRKFIFVHIPKTGGTALATALEARAMKDDILIGDTPKAKKRRHRANALATLHRLHKHSKLAELGGAVDLSDKFVLCLVRNPWDRLLSYYTWLRAQTFNHSAVTLAKSTDFAQFLASPQTKAAQRSGPAISYGGPDAHYARLEHLDTDLALFWDHLGFTLEIPRLNTSDRPRDWRASYTDQTAAIVADCCADDISRFGYTFDPT